MTNTGSTERRSVVERYGPWVALYAAIALTASGEFELASLVGFPGWIAWALPTAIDVYVVQAMRRHRDVLGALVLMVATNATYHLAASGLFGVTGAGMPAWWLIVLVAAIAPMIVWRVHRITEDRIPLTDATARQDTPADPPTTPAPVDNSASPAPTVPVELPAVPVATQAAPVADNSPTTTDSSTPQDTTEPAAPAANRPASSTPRKPAKTSRPRPSKKAPRRSMDEWVDLAAPIFHAEFGRLRRQPTASEFATAIDAAGHGRVSDSTAKNIRTEILDRADIPALDQTD